MNRYVQNRLRISLSLPIIYFCVMTTALAAEPEPKLSAPQDITFTARCDQSQQRYILMLPEMLNAQQSHSVLIALHGHGSDRWQFVKEQRGECKAARDFAAKHQLLYVSPDYRARTSWMGPQAEADLVQIIDDLKKQYQIKQVYLCGGSMGGSSSLTFAALHPELIDGVAAMNPTANHLEYDKFQPAIQASFGGTKQDIPEEYKKRSAEYWPEKFTMPVSISVGGQDQLVPPDSARRLAQILKQLNRPVLLIDRPRQGHSTSYEDSYSVLEFMREKSVQQKQP
ncbi:alpha/beta hydrolase family protein [Gimesia sp.]|uniref:alpha/beta hydrolase family protein n=1 Tax=Gimesia sp. TaxID=2024833 RepID=UPI003A91C138